MLKRGVLLVFILLLFIQISFAQQDSCLIVSANQELTQEQLNQLISEVAARIWDQYSQIPKYAGNNNAILKVVLEGLNTWEPEPKYVILKNYKKEIGNELGRIAEISEISEPIDCNEDCRVDLRIKIFLGEYNEAISLARAFLSFDGVYVPEQLHYLLALALERSGNVTEAVDQYATILEDYCPNEEHHFCVPVENRLLWLTGTTSESEEILLGRIREINDIKIDPTCFENCIDQGILINLISDINKFLRTYPNSEFLEEVSYYEVLAFYIISNLEDIRNNFFPDRPISYFDHEEEVIYRGRKMLANFPEPNYKNDVIKKIYEPYTFLELAISLNLIKLSEDLESRFYASFNEFYEGIYLGNIQNPTIRDTLVFIRSLLITGNKERALSLLDDLIRNTNNRDNFYILFEELEDFIDNDVVRVIENLPDYYPEDQEIESLVMFAQALSNDGIDEVIELFDLIKKYPKSEGGELAFKNLKEKAGLKDKDFIEAPAQVLITPINPLPENVEIDLSLSEPILAEYELFANFPLRRESLYPELVNLDTGNVIYDPTSSYTVEETGEINEARITLQIRRNTVLRDNERGYKLNLYIRKNEDSFFLAYEQPFRIITFTQIASSCEQLELSTISNQGDIKVYIIGENYLNFEEFREDMIKIIDENAEGTGLLAVEPFKSNKGRFSFYYNPQIYQHKSTSQFLPGEVARRCPRDVTMVISKKGQRAFAEFGEYLGIFGDSGIGWVFLLNEPEPGRVFVHEFGHAFGKLWDEYTSGDSTPPRWLQLKPNCARTKEEAEELWGDLVGVGEDYLEIGYYTDGCMHDKNLIRSTRESIMNNQDFIAEEDWEIGFGAVNERCLLKIIEEGGRCNDQLSLAKFTQFIKTKYEKEAEKNEDS